MSIPKKPLVVAGQNLLDLFEMKFVLLIYWLMKRLCGFNGNEAQILVSIKYHVKK